MEEDLFGDSFPSLSEDFLHTSNSEVVKKRKSEASIMEELGDATMAAMVNNIELNASNRKLLSTTMEVVGDLTMAALMCPEASEKPLHSSTPSLDRKSSTMANSSHVSKESPQTDGAPKVKLKGSTSTGKHLSREPANAQDRPGHTLVNQKEVDVKAGSIEGPSKVACGKDLVVTPKKPISNHNHKKVSVVPSTKSKRVLDQSISGKLLDTRKGATKNPLPMVDHQTKAQSDFVSARSLLGKETVQEKEKSCNQEQRLECVKDFVTARSLVEEADTGKDSAVDADLEEGAGERVRLGLL